MDSTNEIAKALVEAQKKIESAHKDKTNPHFKNRYATLEAVWDACHRALSENGIAVTQTLHYSQMGAAILRTSLLHTSGQSIISECPLLNPKGDMQGLGSAITYARRYSLAAIVGVTQDDDDGEGSSARGGTSKTITEAQGKRLYMIATSELKQTKDWYLGFIKDSGYENPSDILMSDYEAVEKKMRAKPGGKNG